LFVFEDVLRSRDRARGVGGNAGDRGTRLQLGIALLVAMVAAAVLAATARPDSPLGLPGYPWIGVAGLVTFCGGLALRIWAVAVLGRSFRTTVEVDTDQFVVMNGPYRLIRHPSYTGLLLMATGCGLLSHTWPGLVLLALVPLLPLLRRIQVEELEMTRVLGERYRAYSARTKRLIPGLW
jgi:protein-S-isoprenylcysteine O-methyltransferase Ste14